MFSDCAFLNGTFGVVSLATFMGLCRRILVSDSL